MDLDSILAGRIQSERAPKEDGSTAPSRWRSSSALAPFEPRNGPDPGQNPRVSTEHLEEAYADLLQIAARRLSQLPRGFHDYEPCSLVHDAYLRLMLAAGTPLSSVGEMRFAMGRAMHDELVESARRAASLKHGGIGRRIDLYSLDEELATEDHEETMLEVLEAVKKLKQQDPVNARIVTLRFFGGLTTEETSQIVGCSVTTVERKWRALKEWLARELRF